MSLHSELAATLAASTVLDPALQALVLSHRPCALCTRSRLSVIAAVKVSMNPAELKQCGFIILRMQEALFILILSLPAAPESSLPFSLSP